MDFWNWLGGVARIRVTGADIAGSLSAISQAGLVVLNAQIVDELNAFIVIRRKDRRKLVEILITKGNDYEIVEVEGLYWKLKQLLKL